MSLIVSKAIYYFENEVGRDPTNLMENIYQQLTATIPSAMSQNILKVRYLEYITKNMKITHSSF